MAKNYLKEIVGKEKEVKDVDDFHRFFLPYLGKVFFPDKKSKILDVGVGLGDCSFSLKAGGWNNLWGADIDDFNRSLLEKNGIVFSCLDLEKDKFPFAEDFFDVVLSFHVIEHLAMPDNYLNEIRRVLRPGGKIFLVTPDWRKQYKTFWRDPTHLRPYDKESLGRLFNSYEFRDIDIRSFGVFRGLGRTGLWHYFKSLMFTGSNIIVVARK